MPAGKSIIVTPQELNSTADHIDDLNKAYVQAYESIYLQTEKLSDMWKSEDILAFASRLEEYRSCFERMNMLLTDYSKFLKKTAQAYADMQKRRQR